jgi:uncharacterized cupin superfamily protein
MERVNIAEPSFRYDPDDPEGFRAGMYRFGGDLGAKQTGTSVYELPPGQAVCPYHYEYGEEEWVLVLDGRPSVRTPDGVEQLEPFDVVFFPMGPAGYPDSDKVALWTGVEGEDVMVPRSSHVEYFHGETG